MTMFLSSLAPKVADIMLAQAEGTEGASPGSPLDSIGGILPLVLMFGVIYFLLIRPANKQRREHAELLNKLKKDDEVVTNGGIYGKIVGLDEKVATIEIADKIKIRIMRDRIAGRWNPEAPPRN